MAIEASSVDEMEEKLSKFLLPVDPDCQVRDKALLAFEINKLKKERGAIILGHNYMEPALYYGVADIVGDSLQLSKEAVKVKADPIVFCGVRFMAETAKILNPDKTVLLPAKKAGCSLAASITAEDVRNLKKKYPGIPVVVYINSYADVKAECDVCCTSSNAADIVRKLDSEVVIFIPDEYLSRNVAKETGKTILVPKKEELNNIGLEKTENISMLAWPGKCEVHDKFTVSDIENVRAQFPEVTVLAHPECPPEVIEKADFSGSTSKMIDYVAQHESPQYLLLTECAMGDNIIAENPKKNILRLCSVRCPHMNEITLEDTLIALKKNTQIIELPEDVRIRAKRSLDRMLELS
ncbi:MAG: quinolinate synthase NadA [Bdellovibrionales bacterium]|nr:quinolinate synthase NadA [Bdellovibrionales bacterium]